MQKVLLISIWCNSHPLATATMNKHLVVIFSTGANISLKPSPYLSVTFCHKMCLILIAQRHPTYFLPSGTCVTCCFIFFQLFLTFWFIFGLWVGPWFLLILNVCKICLTFLQKLIIINSHNLIWDKRPYLKSEEVDGLGDAHGWIFVAAWQ